MCKSVNILVYLVLPMLSRGFDVRLVQDLWGRYNVEKVTMSKYLILIDKRHDAVTVTKIS